MVALSRRVWVRWRSRRHPVLGMRLGGIAYGSWRVGESRVVELPSDVALPSMDELIDQYVSDSYDHIDERFDRDFRLP